MQIRTATRTDADAIAHLHAESWRVAYRGALSDAYLDGPIDAERTQVWRARFANPEANQFVALAHDAGKLVGFVCAYGGEDRQWGTFLDNLHVAHGYKRHGIGARLMAETAAWSARNYPGQGIYLWVLESNAPARAFYESLGGAIAGRDLWTPPDGSALPKLRIAWEGVDVLRERCYVITG